MKWNVILFPWRHCCVLCNRLQAILSACSTGNISRYHQQNYYDIYRTSYLCSCQGKSLCEIQWLGSYHNAIYRSWQIRPSSTFDKTCLILSSYTLCMTQILRLCESELGMQNYEVRFRITGCMSGNMIMQKWHAMRPFLINFSSLYISV